MSRASSILAFLILFAFYSERAAGQTTNPNSQSATNSAAAKEPLRRVSLATPNASAEAVKLYEEGLKLSEAGQYPQAVEKFQQAIRNDSEYADAYSALGRTYFKMQQWQNAIDNLRRAAVLNTKFREEQEALQQRLAARAIETPLSAEKTLRETSKKPEPKATSKAAPPKLTLVAPATAQIRSTFVALKVVVPSTGTDAPKPVDNHSRAAAPPKLAVAGPVTAQVRSSFVPNTVVPTSIGIDAPKPSDNPTVAVKAPDQIQQPIGSRVSLNVTPTAEPLETKAATPVLVKPSTENVSLTKIYHVGPGDVIDVRLNDSQSPASTLFTITPAGFLEHPALADPLPVSGLTVEEIASKIEDDLKKRAIVENPRAIVAVRDYTSHTVLVSGLVKDSGTKFLRREAIPLYVVVADAQPLPEAAKVTVVRNDSNQIYDIDLSHAAEMNLLVRPGDVITLQPNETQFIYIGGEVRLPGEKTFRRGLTLTQAILTAGGLVAKAKEAQIDRDDGRGFLVGTRFNLKDIGTGKTADPALKPGDRIMISH